MCQRLCKDIKNNLDRAKSTSSSSLRWEDVFGVPIDLHNYVETCWNNLTTVNSDMSGITSSDAILETSKIQDSSSLNDGDRSSELDKDNNLSRKSSIYSVEQHNRNLGDTNEVDEWNLILQELIETENAYIESLEEVENGYLNMFDFRFRNTEEIEIIFSNWKELLSFHSQLIRQMNATQASGFSGLHKLALCFSNNVDKFEELYSVYCANYSRSIKHLNGIERIGSDVWQYLIECQWKLGHQLPLSTFLLKPVQRILKYQLILQRLIRCCQSVPNEEAGNITECLIKANQEMINVANRINEHQTKQDDLAYLLQLRNELYFEITSFNSYFSELGLPFHKGTLKISGCKNPKMALLCEHAFILAKNLGNGRWDVKQVIQCEKMMLFEYIPKQPLGFYLVDLNNPKSKSKVLAMTKEDKDIWCTKIKELIIASYDASLISDRSKKILLENKQNVLAMNEINNNCVLDSHKVKLKSEEEDFLDLETSVRCILNPSLEDSAIYLKRRSREVVNKKDFTVNISEHETNPDNFTIGDDSDCEADSLTVHKETSDDTIKGLVQTYERYIEVTRFKIMLTPDDIDNIFFPLRQISNTKECDKDLASSMANPERTTLSSDPEPPDTRKPITHPLRKEASADRIYDKVQIDNGYSYFSPENNCTFTDVDYPKHYQRQRAVTVPIKSQETLNSDTKRGIVQRWLRGPYRFGKWNKTKNVRNLNPAKNLICSLSSMIPDQKSTSLLKKTFPTYPITEQAIIAQKQKNKPPSHSKDENMSKTSVAEIDENSCTQNRSYKVKDLVSIFQANL